MAHVRLPLFCDFARACACVRRGSDVVLGLGYFLYSPRQYLPVTRVASLHLHLHLQSADPTRARSDKATAVDIAAQSQQLEVLEIISCTNDDFVSLVIVIDTHRYSSSLCDCFFFVF